MRYTLLVVAAVAALAASGAAYSSLAAGGPSDDPFVVGGGRLGPGTFPGGFTILSRDFSVDAHVEKKGQKVTGLFSTGRNGISSSQTNVTCVSIDGNQAVVGGVDNFGSGRVVFLIDNGPPSRAVRDQSSPNFVDPVDSPNWPIGFPYVCPAPNSGFNQQGYLDVHSGDIVISDGDD
jgi:hypothetical protein